MCWVGRGPANSYSSHLLHRGYVSELLVLVAVGTQHVRLSTVCFHLSMSWLCNQTTRLALLRMLATHTAVKGLASCNCAKRSCIILGASRLLPRG